MTVKRIRAGTVYRPVDDNSDPILYFGELGIDADTGAMKIGDGETPWSGLAALPTSSSSSSTVDGGTP